MKTSTQVLDFHLPEGSDLSVHERSMILKAMEFYAQQVKRQVELAWERNRNELAAVIDEQQATIERLQGNPIVLNADDDDEIQKFWEIVSNLSGKGIIKQGNEFILDGNNLLIRFTPIYGLYIEEYQKIGYMKPPSVAISLRNKLKCTSPFIEFKNSHRFGEVNTSCMVFNYQQLKITIPTSNSQH